MQKENENNKVILNLIQNLRGRSRYKSGMTTLILQEEAPDSGLPGLRFASVYARPTTATALL